MQASPGLLRALGGDLLAGRSAGRSRNGSYRCEIRGREGAQLLVSAYEDIKLEGHIIDSLLLPQVLDDILERGGEYRILRFKMGKEKDDPSLALLRVTATGRGRVGPDPARPPAPRRRARRPERRSRRAGAGRRRLSRGLLLHHQPGDLHPFRGQVDPGGVGRRWTAASSSTPRPGPPGPCLSSR